MALTATSSEMSFSLSKPRRAVMSMSTRFPPLVRLSRRTRSLGPRGRVLPGRRPPGPLRGFELHLHAATPQLAEAEPAPHGLGAGGLRPGGPSLPLPAGRSPVPRGGGRGPGGLLVSGAGSLALLPALLDDVDLDVLVVGRHDAALDLAPVRQRGDDEPA